MTRPGWDDYFLGIAESVAARGECHRRQVGAVLVNSQHHIVATGYNGAAPGAEQTCLTGHCPRATSGVAPYSPYTNCISKHAEHNCLDQANARMGSTWPERMTMYITCAPCDDCWTLLAHHDIDEVVWQGNQER